MASPRLVGALAALVAALVSFERAAVAEPPDAPAPSAPPSSAPPPSVLPPPPDPVTLDVGVRVGGAVRIGDSASLPITSRSGSMLGVSVAIAPTQRFAIGLAYEHGDLGAEHGEGDVGVVDVTRSLDAVWASLRVTLYRNDRVALGVLIGPGLAWQHASMNAILYGTSSGTGTWTPDTFTCSDSGGPNLGLRAGLGADVALGGGFFLNLEAVMDELRLSSDLLGTCAPGAGSTAVFGARGGFAYRFDVSRGVR